MPAHTVFSSVDKQLLASETPRGLIQAESMAVRSLASLVAAGTAIGVHMFATPREVVMYTCVFPFITALVAPMLVEHAAPRSLPRTAAEGSWWAMVGRLIRTRVVAIFSAMIVLIRPTIFVFLTHVTPSSMDAYYNFLYSEFTFPTWMYSVMNFIALAGGLLGAMLYWKLFAHRSLRKVFFFATLVDIIAGFPLAALPGHLNRDWGIPDLAYISVASFFDSIFARVALMPSIVLAAESCPPQLGLEATMFSVFTSVGNAGALISSAVSIFTMRKLEIKQNHWDNLPLFMIICLLAQLLPLMFLPLLPAPSGEAMLPEEEKGLLGDTDEIESINKVS
jgi:hypothetical protein